MKVRRGIDFILFVFFLMCMYIYSYMCMFDIVINKYFFIFFFMDMCVYLYLSMFIFIGKCIYYVDNFVLIYFFGFFME